MITQAAIIDNKGKIWTLPRPNRHSDIFSLITYNVAVSMGFVDDSGNFYTREQAWKHAIDSKQTFYIYNPINPSDRRIDDNPNVCGSLFSEDLW